MAGCSLPPESLDRLQGSQSLPQSNGRSLSPKVKGLGFVRGQEAGKQ